MASASYVQTNFWGGEFSSAFQGRVDDQDYKRALALCLNYIPTQEGSLLPRSGMKRCGNTKNNDVAKLLPFRFSNHVSYVAEHTYQNIRLWSNGFPIFDTSAAQVTAVSGNPPTFTLLSVESGLAQVPTSWTNGCSILVLFNDATDTQAAPHLGNREFIVNITGAATVTLTDAVTGSPLTGAITFASNTPFFYRILDIPTVYRQPAGVRQIELTDQVAVTVPGTTEVTFSEPDHRVTYLYPIVSPQSFSYQQSLGPSTVNPTVRVNSNMALVAESFIDGPYFDPPSSTTPMTVSGTTGVVTVTYHQWDTRLNYSKGDLVCDYTQDPTDDCYYYMSLVDNNLGHALPATAAAGSVNSRWLQLNFQRNTWASGTTFALGQACTAAYYDGHNAPAVEAPVYYSKQAANTGHAPATSASWWGTTPPAWDIAATYAAGSIVTSVAITYVAVSAPVVGTAPAAAPTVWLVLPLDLNSAATTITSTTEGWLNGPLFYADDEGGTNSSIGLAYDTDNPGRLIRLKWGPQPWTNKVTYALNDLVNYNDNIYKSLIGSNLNNIPDVSADDWELQAKTILWTWGRVTDAHLHQFMAKVEILGPDLPSNMPIWSTRMGVYSDTTGWPTCGCYHEGRIYLGGMTPNRVDAGVVGQGFNFAPTAPNGAVSDANGISMTLNSNESETVQALASITEGVMLLTSEAEWLVAASALNDPITPTSAQVHRTTSWSALKNEATRLPSALAAIQNGGRRVFEYRIFADAASYQARLNASDITRKCQHLTVGGVGQTQYQALCQPVLWLAPQSSVTFSFGSSFNGRGLLRHTICAVPSPTPSVSVTDIENQTSTAAFGNMFGIAYQRSPDVTYTAPFSFEHGLQLANDSPYIVSSIAVQRGYAAGTENLYAVIASPDDFLHYVDMMMPLFESDPLDTTYLGNGHVSTYGTLATSYFLDSGVTPIGCKIATNGLSVTFYGLMPHAGNTVSFTIMGKYVGDFAVGSNGSVIVPFSTGFVIQDIGDAMNFMPGKLNESSGLGITGINETVNPAYFTEFSLDANGNTITAYARSMPGFFGQFGYKFRRRGKMLRPQVGGQNGPTFAKITQNARAGIYLDAAHEIKAGTDFSSLVTLPLRVDEPKDMTLLGVGDVMTGIVRGFIKDGNTFNGQICWEQTEPYPGSILSVGGFSVTEDV